MQRVQLEFPAEDIVHRHALTVRIGDINYGRHLGHDALITLLHEARAQAFVALGFHEGDVAGHPSVVADLAVQYRAEVKWPDALEVETAIPAPEERGFAIFQRLVRPADARTVAVARLGLVLLDTETGRPTRVPAALTEALTRAKWQGAD